MVRFAKELQSQLVPEWQEAYCNYDELKEDLRRIQHHRLLGPTYTRTGSLGLLRSLASMKPNLSKTLTRTLTRRGRPEYMSSLSSKPGQQSKDTLLIDKKRALDGTEIYVSELREPLSQSPQDRTFFARLDAQLTKVNKFYKKKEAENIARAGALEKQMLSLIHLQETLARQGLDYAPTDFPTVDNSDANDADELHINSKGVSDELPLIDEDTVKSDHDYQMQTFPLTPSRRDRAQIHDDESDNAIQDYIDQVAAKNLRSPGHGEVRFEPDSPTVSSVTLKSAMKKVSTIPEPVEDEKVVVEDVVRLDDIENQKVYSQKELDHARKVLRQAFVEFYRGLSMLSNYRSLNITAFAKILKKYDKITGWNFLPIYMKEVESSHFVVSKKIHKLMSKVEDIFTKHFAEGQRKKAVAQLRPTRRQGTHRTTFFLGLFTGCSLALLVSFFFLVENPLSFDHGGGNEYLDTVFPVFSTLMLITIHMYFYGFNVYAWQRTRINYPFIFGFSPGTELRYREVLLLSTGFTTFLLGGMNIHISVTLLTHKGPDPSFSPSPSQHQGSKFADIIPLLLVLISLGILFFPFNTMYRSSRAFFLDCFRRLALAPLFKVVLADFFLGDQFTSQVLVFRNLEFIACYYSGGFFLSKEDEACKKNLVYQGFGYVVALLPYWWRFLQCLRRYKDEGDTHQLENAGKYMSAIIAVGLRQAYTNYRHLPSHEVPLRVLFIIASIIATIYTNYWDLCVDWGLLNSQSKNRWLRDKLILRNKKIYFAAIAGNSFLRLAWLATLLQVQASYGFNQNAFDVIMASLEILRRGIWNFFRIENEHLNNVGKYRAEKAVPLPFNDDM
ncbi:hypothetical protein M758_2G242000 [Ceratodon purpureus]|nr:hypothetical protein M758_2G242000 [Ceratodon purpureus]